ncbi:MAG TPA: choice-of-anchor V domain-containing protein, partial [Bacteroidia bacterium]|nr:choice-of-anchor V domain-containing protein [Bacteroidia bacterium]
PIKIRISEPNVERFGFQIVALADQTKENAGIFKITDPERTQFMKNEFELMDRKYVTYTFSGTDAVSNGVGEWTINWTAPSNTAGDITFYASAVSANDDGTDKGDVVYTASNTLINQ